MEPLEHPIAVFLKGIEDERRQQDTKDLIKLMYEETGVLPKMWGTSMIGFGTYHYKYASGREGDTMIVGFSPRKPATVFYGLLDCHEPQQLDALVKKLGPVKLGKGCMYIKHLSDVDEKVLRYMVKEVWQQKSEGGDGVTPS